MNYDMSGAPNSVHFRMAMAMAGGVRFVVSEGNPVFVTKM